MPGPLEHDYIAWQIWQLNNFGKLFNVIIDTMNNYNTKSKVVNNNTYI